MRKATLLFVTLVYSLIASAQVAVSNSKESPKWIVIPSESIDFYFQDTVNLPMPAYEFVASREMAYQKLNTFFQATLPKRLQFYVWTDPKLAERLLGIPLGFSSAQNCVCNVLSNQTRGHEITHVLSYWAWGEPRVEKTLFIDEGLATAFNLRRGVDFLEEVRAPLKASGYKSILEVWESSAIINANLLYPAGGAFMQYAFKKLPKTDFQALVKYQTITHTKSVLGQERFKAFIADFDKLVGLK